MLRQRFTRNVRHPQRWFGLALAASTGTALLGTAGVMLSQLPVAYWFDEANTIYYVRQPFSRMLTYVANDWFPPAYYFVLKGWVMMLGASEAATGSLSLLLLLATAGLTYGFGRRLFGHAVAGGGAALLWVSHAALSQATETRMYSLLMAIGVASSWLLFALWRAPRGWPSYLGYGALVAFGAYTHYPFWFLAAAQLIGMAWLQRHSPRYLAWKRLLPVLGGAVLAYLPQFAVLFDRVMDWYLGPMETWVDMMQNQPGLFVQLATELLLRPEPRPPAWLAVAVPTAMLLALLAAWVALERNRRSGELRLTLRPLDPGVAFLTMLVVVPLAVYYLLHVQVLKYAVYLTPFLCLLVARGMSHLPRRWFAPGSVAGLVALLAFWNGAAVQRQPFHPQSVPWPDAASFLERNAAQDRTVIAANYEDAITLGYYYHGGLPIIRLVPLDVPPGRSRTIAEIRGIGKSRIAAATVDRIERQLADTGAEDVWLVQGEGAIYNDPQRELAALLGRRCRHGDERTFPQPAWRFGLLQVSQFYGCRFTLAAPPR